MDSHLTPDVAEKGIVVQSRRPYVTRGWGLLALSFSSLGEFFRVYLAPVHQ
jgi:hypothetical protein